MSNPRERIATHIAAAKQYYGSELYRTFVDLLQAIEDAYKDDLIDVPEEALKHKQGAAKQARVLRVELVRQEQMRDLPKI